MNKCFFEPYIGNRFGDPDNMFGGKRILAVGHNHHCEWIREPGMCRSMCEGSTCCQQPFTKEIIDEYLNVVKGKTPWRDHMSTFRSFANFLTSNQVNGSHKDAWESIAFYNFAQFAIPSKDDNDNQTAKYRGNTQQEYDLSNEPFLQVLRELKPDIVLCWSVGNVYNRIPKGEYWHFSEEMLDGKAGLVGYYNLDGHSIKVIGMRHPAIGFSPSRWHDMVFPIMGLK